MLNNLGKKLSEHLQDDLKNSKNPVFGGAYY